MYSLTKPRVFAQPFPKVGGGDSRSSAGPAPTRLVTWPGRTPGALRSLLGWALLLLAGVLLFMFSPVARAQTVKVNWVQWQPPTSYPNTLPSPNDAYHYADSISGTLDTGGPLPVNVTMTGEVLDISCPTGFPCPLFSQYWFGTGGWDGTGPGGFVPFPSGIFTSVNVPDFPFPSGSMVAQTGFADQLHVLTFDKPVTNIVMDIASLGSVGIMSSYTFTQDFVILSQDSRCTAPPTGNFCMTKDGHTLIGYEGSGTIEFVGTYTSIEWVVTAPEVYSGFAIGVTSATAPATLTLKNQWSTAATAGDTMSVANVEGTNGTATLNSTALSGGGNTDAMPLPLPLLSGNTVTLIAPTYPSTDSNSYSPSVSCTIADPSDPNNPRPLPLTGSSSGPDAPFPYTFAIDPAAGQQIVCTYVSRTRLEAQAGGSGGSGALPIPTSSPALLALLGLALAGCGALVLRRRAG